MRGFHDSRCSAKESSGWHLARARAAGWLSSVVVIPLLSLRLSLWRGRMNIPTHCLCDHIYLRERSDDAPFVASQLQAQSWTQLTERGCEVAVTHRYGQKYSTTAMGLTAGRQDFGRLRDP